jgi:hypothetical protein
MPATSKPSLMVIGSPSSGSAFPALRRASDAAGRLARAGEIRPRHGVERRVERLDAGDRRLEQVGGGQSPVAELGQQGRGRVAAGGRS